MSPPVIVSPAPDPEHTPNILRSLDSGLDDLVCVCTALGDGDAAADNAQFEDQRASARKLLEYQRRLDELENSHIYRMTHMAQAQA